MTNRGRRRIVCLLPHVANTRFDCHAFTIDREPNRLRRIERHGDRRIQEHTRCAHVSQPCFLVEFEHTPERADDVEARLRATIAHIALRFVDDFCRRPLTFRRATLTMDSSSGLPAGRLADPIGVGVTVFSNPSDRPNRAHTTGTSVRDVPDRRMPISRSEIAPARSDPRRRARISVTQF